MSEKTPPSAEEQQEEARYKAACDALLAPYKGGYYAERPRDPRVLDTGRLRSIRERLMDYYYYRWREKEANGELLEALYGGIKGSTGSYVTISTDMVYVNDDGTDVGFYYRREYRDYQKCFHMTLSGLRMRNFITNYDDARALKGSLLPDWGVTVRDWPAGISVRLEKEERHEEWVTGGSVPLLIVVATLDYLIKHPEEAQLWRSI